MARGVPGVDPPVPKPKKPIETLPAAPVVHLLPGEKIDFKSPVPPPVVPTPGDTAACVALEGFVTDKEFSCTARLDAAESLVKHRDQVPPVCARAAVDFLVEVIQNKVRSEPRERVRAAAILLAAGWGDPIVTKMGGL
jgi:hypothetical protein